MNVLVVEPGMAPYEKEISGSEEMRATVGGPITASYPCEESIAIVSNEDSIGMGLPFNRSIEGGYGGIFGPFFVCGMNSGVMDENQGYVIQHWVLFDNGRGFALGEHPREGFVTWQFTEEQGRRDYYWGHYHSDGAAAQRDYADRTTDYQRRYEVHIRTQGEEVKAVLAPMFAGIEAVAKARNFSTEGLMAAISNNTVREIMELCQIPTDTITEIDRALHGMVNELEA